MCQICRYYPAYDLEKCGDLTWPQVNLLLKQIGERPYQYVVMVEPKQ